MGRQAWGLTKGLTSQGREFGVESVSWEAVEGFWAAVCRVPWGKNGLENVRPLEPGGCGERTSLAA